jgi:hypothetical protein
MTTLAVACSIRLALDICAMRPAAAGPLRAQPSWQATDTAGGRRSHMVCVGGGARMFTVRR